MTTTLYPAKPERIVTAFVPREISDAEWRLIQRLRQLRRAGEGETVLVDPRAMTLRVVLAHLEKLDL